MPPFPMPHHLAQAAIEMVDEYGEARIFGSDATNAAVLLRALGYTVKESGVLTDFTYVVTKPCHTVQTSK